MKRLLTVLLAGLLAAGAVTGCSQEPGASSAAAPSADGSSSAAESSSAAGEADTSEQVNLVYYYWGTPQNDLASVNEALNEYLLEKMNTTVELKLIDGGTYDSKMALVMSGNEEYDLCFTSSWANNYYTNVANGAYVDMGPLLDAYAPVTKETAPQRFWDAITVNGRIYGAINFQQSAAGFGFRVQAPLADKYEFDWQNAKQLSDIEPFLEDIKANEPTLIPFGYNRTVDPFVKGPIAWGYDAIGDIFSPGWVALDDESLTVVNQYDTDAFREYTALMRSWYEKGYLRADAATLSDVTPDVKAGKYAIEYEQIDLGTEDFEAAGLEYQGRMYPYSGIVSYDHKFIEPILTNEKASATMTSISVTSRHPERAMMFIELMNTDRYAYNLLCNGIEGKHYTREGELINIIADGGYQPFTSWEFGNMANCYIASGNWPAGGEEIREDGLTVANGMWYDLNQNVEGSPLLGFVFDAEPVKSEIANCQAVIDQLYYSISCGSVDPETYIPQFNDQLKAAGMEKIIAEKQKQLDEWKAAL